MSTINIFRGSKAKQLMNGNSNLTRIDRIVSHILPPNSFSLTEFSMSNETTNIENISYIDLAEINDDSPGAIILPFVIKRFIKIVKPCYCYKPRTIHQG